MPKTMMWSDLGPDLQGDLLQGLELQKTEVKGGGLGLNTRTIFRIDHDAGPVGVLGRGRASETNSRVSEVLQALRKTGLERPWVHPVQSWQTELTSLAEQMPNFEPVIRTVVRPHVQLVSMGIQHRMAPVLLLGAPGVGKTHFARRLARILGLAHPLQVTVAAETNGSTLAGSSVFWSNSAPGLLFEALAWGAGTGTMAANPIVLIDELDKASRAGERDPIGALYTLMEADTARDFRDQALPDIRIDASGVRWVCTANESDAIPQPLRSRMWCFEIEAPSRSQQRVIALGIYRMLLKDYRLSMADDLPGDVLDRAATLPPREARLALDCAIAQAVSRGSHRVQWVDWAHGDTMLKRGLRQRVGFGSSF